MPRTFTAFVAQVPDPESFAEQFDRFVDDDYRYERAEPRDSGEGRVRFEMSGFHWSEIGEAIETGELGPVEWAVIMKAMDEAIGVNAWVYDGTECIDEFEGAELLSGLDTEAYLERFHGVLVDRAGPYMATGPYRPSEALAVVEPPERSLASEPPTGPFEISGDPVWLVVEGMVDDPDAFVEWLATRVSEPSPRRGPLRFGSVHDRPWVSDGPLTLAREEPTVEEPGRVRFRVPLTGVVATTDGFGLPDAPRLTGAGGYDGAVEWLVFLLGDDGAEQVEAWLFIGSSGSYLRWDEATDGVVGDEGRRGADVEAYLRRFYGIEVSPIPAGHEPHDEIDELPSDATEPSPQAVRDVERSGFDPGPDMPDPDR